MNSKSFTLIELLVVIVIIGILAGVIMISTSSSIDKANIAKLKVFDESIKNNLMIDLISEWKLDNNTEDIWGNNNASWGGTGGPNTAITYKSESECISGTCLDFDGYDDYLEIPYNASLSPSEVTISFWIKLTSDPNTSADNNWRLLYKNLGGGAPFYLYLEQPKNINFSVIVSGVEYRYISNIFSSEALTVNEWAFLTYSYSRDGYGKAYKNSVLSRSGKMRTSAGVDCPGGNLQQSAASNWRISNSSGTNTPIGSGAIPGMLDEFKIYGKPLTQSRMKQNYIAGLDSLLSKELISKKEYSEKIEILSLSR